MTTQRGHCKAAAYKFTCWWSLELYSYDYLPITHLFDSLALHASYHLNSRMLARLADLISLAPWPINDWLHFSLRTRQPYWFARCTAYPIVFDSICIYPPVPHSSSGTNTVDLDTKSQSRSRALRHRVGHCPPSVYGVSPLMCVTWQVVAIACFLPSKFKSIASAL